MAEPQVVPNYRPGPVERFGRRLKMEYVGMASVFTVVAILFFGDLDHWYQSVAAMMGIYGLFMGIKKKTRDHLMASFLMFGAAAVARPGLMAQPSWSLTFLFFGALVLIMEGYLERLQNHVYALPVLFALWGATDATWVLGMVFMAPYLTLPLREEVAHWRPRFFKMAPLALVAAIVATAFRWKAVTAGWTERLVPETAQLPPATVLGVTVMGAVVLAALAIYWRRLILPHRLNPLVFGALAVVDIRLTAVFGLVGAVLLSATFFRLSIDSDKLRPFFKHAEWHFFWWVLALAIWAGVFRS